MKESSKPEEMVLDRDRLMNDFTNTGVMAALVGGFALGEFAEDRGDDLIAGIRTVLMFIAVHACTYAAICSALFYRAVNLLSDQGAEEWGRRHSTLAQFPILSFAMGGGCYIVGVVFVGLAKSSSAAWQGLYIGFGGMCCMGLVVSAALAAK